MDMRGQAAYPWTQVSMLDAADIDTRAVGRDGIDQVIQRDGIAANAAGDLRWACRGIGTEQSGSLLRGVRTTVFKDPTNSMRRPARSATAATASSGRAQLPSRVAGYPPQHVPGEPAHFPDVVGGRGTCIPSPVRHHSRLVPS